MKKLLIAAAAMALLTGSAQAADIPAPAPAYKGPAMVAPPRATWTGCYVGVGGGYGMWNQEHTTYDAAGVSYFREVTTGGRGYFGTVQGGCDYQVSQFVVGVFGDYDFSSLKGTYNDVFRATSGSEKLKWQWAAGRADRLAALRHAADLRFGRLHPGEFRPDQHHQPCGRYAGRSGEHLRRLFHRLGLRVQVRFPAEPDLENRISLLHLQLRSAAAHRHPCCRWRYRRHEEVHPRRFAPNSSGASGRTNVLPRLA